MVCIIELDEGLRFDFSQNKFKQKTWIEVLLNYSKITIDNLAYILEIPVETITKVRQGILYLEKETAVRLGQLFLITFCD